jgi:hypothetical protein
VFSDLLAHPVFGLPLAIPLGCLTVAVVVVGSTYMSPYMNGLAIPAGPNNIAFRSAAKAGLVIFVVLLNAISLFAMHQIALWWTIVALAVFGLLSLPTGPSGPSD